MLEVNMQKKNIFKSLWNYFTTYEKIWLLVMLSAGVVISILFPESQGWVRVFEIITLIGGCTCELLVSKQSKWCFVISFFFYDLTQIVVYVADGYYVSALFEVLFWMPILVVSFFSWDKKKDIENSSVTQVKQINWKKDLLIFIIVLCVSLATGLLFTFLGGFFEGMSEFWYIDALANTFSVCNGLFLWLRYREQWIAWLGVIICETIMWIISQNFIMLVLQVGYLTNTLYGLITWARYIKKHSVSENEN
ncbi:MAG: nicotinamide riboside transporter PnuC [Candidatus Caccovivens sp.]